MQWGTKILSEYRPNVEDPRVDSATREYLPVSRRKSLGRAKKVDERLTDCEYWTCGEWAKVNKLRAIRSYERANSKNRSAAQKSEPDHL